MTLVELCELIDRVVEPRDLHERIQRGRDLRLALVQTFPSLVAQPVPADSVMAKEKSA